MDSQYFLTGGTQMIDYSFLNDTRIIVMLGLILLIFALFLGAGKSTLIRKLFIFVTIAYNLGYLVWRVIFTLPVSFGAVSIIFGVILLLAELMGFWQTMVFRFLFWKPFKIYKSPPTQFEN